MDVFTFSTSLVLVFLYIGLLVLSALNHWFRIRIKNAQNGSVVDTMYLISNSRLPNSEKKEDEQSAMT